MKRSFVVEQLNFVSGLYLLLCRNQVEVAICLSSSALWRTRLLRWVTRHCPKIEWKDYDDFPGAYFETRKQAIEHANEQFYTWAKKSNRLIRFLLSVEDHALVECAIKQSLLKNYVLERVKACVFLQRLSAEQPGKNFVFLPMDEVDFTRFCGKVPPTLEIPKAVMRANALLSKSRSIATVCRIHTNIVAPLKGGLCLRAPNVRHYKVAIDVPYRRFTPKTWDQDSFLYAEGSWKPEDTLHVFRSRLRDPYTRRECETRRYPFVEFGCVNISLKLYVGICYRYYWCFLWSQLWSLSDRICTPALGRSVCEVSRAIFEMDVFLSHFRIGLFVVRDETLPIHQVRTLRMRESGGRTIGFSKGDYLTFDRETTYVSLDVFCVWGEFSIGLFRNSSIGRFEITGPGMRGLDETYRLLKEPSESELPRHRVPRGLRSLVAFDTSFSTRLTATAPTSKTSVLEFYETVIALPERYDDLFIILKPKTDGLDREIKNLLRKSRVQDRIVLDRTATTYELLAETDTMVVNSHSSVGLEGIMVGCKVLYWDNTGGMPPDFSPYRAYDERLVAYTEEEFLRNLDWVLKEDKYLDEEVLERVRKIHGFTFDGRAGERFREAARRLLPTYQQRSST